MMVGIIKVKGFYISLINITLDYICLHFLELPGDESAQS